MKKGNISNFLRRVRLIYLTDWLRYYIQRYKNHKINSNFRKNNSNILLPPDYLIYEAFQINYQKYYNDSIEAAKELAEHFRNHLVLKDLKILDWGCGPGRVIRHLPDIIGNGCEFYGTDYNKKSIEWCSQYITDVKFNLNTLEAKLPYSDEFLDIIYGISIFTHLSEKLHYDWYNELYRILKPNGIMYLTTHGDNYKAKLTEKEIEKFSNSELIARGKVKEGHRTYTSFQPTGFMKSLFHNAEILEHIEIKPEKNGWLPQDIWIIKK
jgi:ubiquinone/menaquinone biosynthesis C-methylase UbiE